MVNKLPPLAGPVDASGEPDLWKLANDYWERDTDADAKAFAETPVIWLMDFAKLVLRAAAVPSSPAQEPPSVACPVCGIVVQQVASATLSLALWQHWNWVCDRRTIPPPPRLTDLQRICNLNVVQAMAVQQYIERWVAALPPSAPSPSTGANKEQ